MNRLSTIEDYCRHGLFAQDIPKHAHNKIMKTVKLLNFVQDIPWSAPPGSDNGTPPHLLSVIAYLVKKTGLEWRAERASETI